jgi:hypothetical protein
MDAETDAADAVPDTAAGLMVAAIDVVGCDVCDCDVCDCDVCDCDVCDCPNAPLGAVPGASGSACGMVRRAGVSCQCAGIGGRCATGIGQL